MTRPDDPSSTRPISVAELLARNGTIGAPPVGGRRRRRRGRADAVTVAELTGEIPVIRDTETPPPPVEEPTGTSDSAETVVDEPSVTEEATVIDEPSVTEEATSTEDVETDEFVETDETTAGGTEAEAEPETEEWDEAETAAEDRDEDGEPDTAEDMSPDAVEGDEEPGPATLVSTDVPELEDFDTEAAFDDDGDVALDEADLDVDHDHDLGIETDIDDEAEVEADTDDDLPSYLRSTSEPLFGGQTLADDIDPGSGQRADLDEDLGEEEYGEPGRMSSFVHGLWIVGQSILAVVFGAGLFIAFNELWEWNNIVALVLSVLVILGLVVAVRVVRKTEDIGSTLIAVAVGALVTLGPLALLQSG